MSNFTKFECPIHMGKIKESEHISLDCDHHFCQNCLFETVIRILDSKKISFFCPIEGCKTEITHYQIKNLVANTEYDNKYEELLMHKTFKQQPKQPEKSVLCKKCNIPYYINNQVDNFCCIKCSQTYCSNCYEIWEEHRDLNCEDLRKRNITPEDKALESYIRQNNIMRCPRCGSLVEKTKYCNFIYCNSSICQKKTIFCYLCGVELNSKDANSHFVDNNAYAFQCINTMQQIKKEIEKNEIPENSISNSVTISAKNFQDSTETDKIQNPVESSQLTTKNTENKAIPISEQQFHARREIIMQEKESEQVENNAKENIKSNFDESFKTCNKIDNKSDFKSESKINNNANDDRISKDKEKHDASHKEITQESKANDEKCDNRSIKYCEFENRSSHRIDADGKEELLENDKNQNDCISKETTSIQRKKKDKKSKYVICGCQCFLI